MKWQLKWSENKKEAEEQLSKYADMLNPTLRYFLIQVWFSVPPSPPCSVSPN